MAGLITTAFGAGALEVLAEQVGHAKSGDPLAPVVVVVPTDRIGVTARRGLARAGVGGRPGVAGITVATLRRLAESIATSELTATGCMPVTRTVLVTALSKLLTEEPGQFREVADHPETARALARAHDHLRLLPPGGLAQIETTSSVAADVVRMHRAASDRLAPTHYDEVDLLTAAASIVTAGAAAITPGRAVPARSARPHAERFRPGPGRRH